MGLITPAGPPTVGPDGLRVHPVQLERRLPRNPTRAYLQALETDPHATQLDEPAATTLSHAVRSLTRLVEGAAVPLVDFWGDRQSGVTPIPQPEAQWPDVNQPEGVPFVGFAPGPRLDGDVLMSVSPGTLGQLDCAGVGERR